MKFDIMSKVGPKMGRLVLKGKKVAPDVAVVGGLALVVVGGVWLGKRAHEGASEINKASAKIKETKEAMAMEGADIAAGKRLLSEARKEFVSKIAKTYGLPIAMIVGGSISVVCGHRELSLRNKGLATALGVEVAKKAKLIERVDKEHGEGTASKWMNDVYEEVVEMEGKNGKKKKQKKELMHSEPTGFATFLCESSTKWHKDPSLTKMMVKNAERYLNSEYRKGRFVSGYEYFLEVGIKPEAVFNKDKVNALKKMGWMMKSTTDPIYISYHIFDVHKEDNERFIQGLENVCIIEPIGMSYIYDL